MGEVQIKIMYLKLGIIVTLFAVQIKTEECTTPNNEKAECISLYTCPILIAALATKHQNSTEFIRRSNCGGTSSDPMVCCGSSANFVTQNKTSIGNDTDKIKLLPPRRYCGYQHSDDYITTLNDSSPTITEFPWLAAIIYNIRNRSIPACGGSLINNRYVLTAAHCITGWAPKLEAVYLGEYNVNNETDCVREPPFEEECSGPVEIFGVEKIIPHPQFNLGAHTHDIALLRLNRSVGYSDYIRPVCLPLPGTKFAKLGDGLTSSGWGLRNSDGNRVEIKKKVLSTLIGNEDCGRMYRNKRININENQLCTITANHSSSSECRGDSGGPLLFSHRYQWHQEGVISFSAGCEGENPTVYTKVVNYIDWILENIEK